MDSLFENIKSLKSQVGYILKKHPQTRNSDSDLVALVCKEFGYAERDKASSIERIRRAYNQRNEYLPTVESVAKERRINIEIWRSVLGYSNQLF